MRNWHEYATPLYLSVLTSLIARLDVDEVDWVGTSLGGHIGMEFAAHAGAPIRRLVLNDFGARIAARALQRISAYLTADAGRRFESVEEIDEHLREILAPFGNLTDEQWRHLAEHGAMPTDDGRFRLRHDPAIAKQFWWPIMIDIVLWQAWDKVQCPTLILRGVHSDLLSPGNRQVDDTARRGRAQRPGAPRRGAGLRSCAGLDGRLADRHRRRVPARRRCRGRQGFRARGARRPAMKTNKVVSAAEAVALILDGDTVACSGFVGCGTPEELFVALEQRFVENGAPRDLTLMFAAAPGDGKHGGLNRLAREGLVRRAIGGHYGLVPKLAQLAVAEKIDAYNLPLGTMTLLYRDIAGHRAGTLTKVGLGTFVDPRQEGGKSNKRTTEDLVRLMEIDGEEWLFFKALPINVALIRGTTADVSGNLTMEREALTLDSLALATAARNSGGLVIAQVERVCAAGELNPRAVVVPGVLVDCVVVAQTDNHRQTYRTVYNPAFAGEFRVPLDAAAPMPLDARKIIARRCAFELPMGGVVNLGIGVPEGVARGGRGGARRRLPVNDGRGRAQSAARRRAGSTSAPRSTPTR